MGRLSNSYDGSVQEEKKSDDGSAASSSFSTEGDNSNSNSGNGNGRIGSILFSRDKGPASNLLTKTSKATTDDSTDTTTDTTEGVAISPVSSILGSTITTTTDTDNAPETPQQQQQRTVKFAGIGDSPFHSTAETPLSMQQQLVLYREKLSQVQIDFQGEKATRKRKEKNLVKLAKQLNKRASESERKDETIVKLTTAVTHMQAQLEATQATASSHGCDMTTAQLQYRGMCREHDVKIQEMQESHNATCLVLQLESQRATQHVEQLQVMLGKMNNVPATSATLKYAAAAPTTTTKSRRNFLLCILVSIVVAMVAFLFSNNQELLSMNALCAPAMPGTTFTEEASNNNMVVMEAPWWVVPASQKEAVFGKLCAGSGRARSRLVVAAGKVTLYDDNAAASSNPIWQKRAASGRVGAHGLELLDKKGQAVLVEAPWSLL